MNMTQKKENSVQKDWNSSTPVREQTVVLEVLPSGRWLQGKDGERYFEFSPN